VTKARVLKALVIFDDKQKFEDLGDVIAVARAEGQKLFKTKEKVNVIEVFISVYGYYVAVVSFDIGRTSPLV